MSLRGVSKDMQVPDITRDEFMRNFHLDDPTSGTQQDSTCSPCNFLESWRTWKFLMNLELVTDVRDHPSEAASRSTSETLSTAETLSRHHLFFKTLPGVLEDIEDPDETGGGVR